MGKPWAIIYLLSSVALSAVIVAWAWAQWKRPQDPQRQELKIAAISLVVLLGTAIFGPFFHKDYLPIIALAGYALVSFYALKWLFAETLQAKRLAAYSLLVALGGGLALSWSIRTAGLVYYLRHVSYSYQFEWAFGIDFLARPETFGAADHAAHHRAPAAAKPLAAAQSPVPRLSQAGRRT